MSLGAAVRLAARPRNGTAKRRSGFGDDGLEVNPNAGNAGRVAVVFMVVGVRKQNQPPRLLRVAGELRTRVKTSAGAFSHPRGGDLDMRHRLPDPCGAWRRRFSGQRLTA